MTLALDGYNLLSVTRKADIRGYEILSKLRDRHTDIHYSSYLRLMVHLRFSIREAESALEHCGCQIRPNLLIDFEALREPTAAP